MTLGISRAWIRSSIQKEKNSILAEDLYYTSLRIRGMQRLCLYVCVRIRRENNFPRRCRPSDIRYIRTLVTRDRGSKSNDGFSFFVRSQRETRTRESTRARRECPTKIIRAVKHPAMGINTCWLPFAFYIIFVESILRETEKGTTREFLFRPPLQRRFSMKRTDSLAFARSFSFFLSFLPSPSLLFRVK